MCIRDRDYLGWPQAGAGPEDRQPDAAGRTRHKGQSVRGQHHADLADFQVLDNGQNDSGAPQGYAKDSRQVYFHNCLLYTSRLKKLIQNANDSIVISHSADVSSYKKRNYYMVDHAEYIIGVFDNQKKLRSGTAQTVNYALRNGKAITLIHPDTMEITTPTT